MITMCESLKTYYFAAFICLQVSAFTFADAEFTCNENGNYLKNNFEYEYDYVGEAVASAVGTTDRVAGMKYECKVHIYSVDRCQYLMKVPSCKLNEIAAPGNQAELYREHSSSSAFSDLMNKNEFLFKLSDGAIIEVKHATDDVLWILNIKRAIVSSFILNKSPNQQTSEWKLHTDVQGTCPQKIIQDVTDDKFTTVKNMLFCRLPQRNFWELSPVALFNNMSFIQNLINSTEECNYEIADSNVKTMTCAERHAILLESTHKTTTAVQTNVKKTLRLVAAKPRINEAVPNTLTVSSGIVYEYEDLPQKLQNSPLFEQTAFKMMADMVQTTNKETRLLTITMFTKFLAYIRTSPDLVSMVNGIKACRFMPSCNKYQKERAIAFLQDALIQCNTPACVKGLHAMLDEVTDLALSMALTSWSFTYVNDPKFIDEVMTICKEKELKTCWLALGTMIGSYAAQKTDLSYRQFPSAVYGAVQHIVDQIGNNCDAGTNDNILTMIQALNNIGLTVYKISPTVALNVYQCFKNDKLSTDTLVAAIRLRGIGPKSATVNEEIWNIVANEDAEARVRIEAYSVMANFQGSYESAKKILDLFSVMKSKHVKSFIASHLSKIIGNDLRDSRRNTEFNPVLQEDGPRPFGNKPLSDHLMILFEEKRYDGLLEEVKNYHGTYSNINSYGRFFELNSWRNYRNSFGALVEDTVIFGKDTLRPNFLSSNRTVEILNNVVNYFEGGLSFKGIFSNLDGQKAEDYVRYIVDALQNIVLDKNAGWDNKKVKFEGLPDISNDLVKNLQAMHLKLEKLIETNPYIMSYIKLAGKYTGILTLADIRKLTTMLQQQMATLPMLMPKLSEGIHRDYHRNIKVIEAYHQFPTSVGLPLNWTTDATLSLSVRASVKLNMNIAQANFNLKPSGALTFVNSMYVVLPTITKAGIQANSSAFTSTKWDFETRLLNKNQIKISANVPNEAQEVLNLFRYNYIVRGNSIEKIPDHDVNRVSKVWCKEGALKTILGIKACHQRSYADVTNKIKPWFPMAGYAKWRLALFKADRDLRAFTMTLSRSGEGNNLIFKIDATAPGSQFKRAMTAELKVGQTTELTVAIPEVPKFGFTYSFKRVANAPEYTYAMSVALNDDEGKLYKISYDSHDVVQKMVVLSSVNASPKDQMEDVQIKDHVFAFVLPHEKYGWTYKIQKRAVGLDANMLFSYDKLVSHTSWLEPILPDIFWEIGKMKSWVLFKAVVTPITISAEKQEVKGLFNLDIPRTDLKVETHRINTPAEVSFILNAKKIEVASKVLKSFADFKYISKFQIGQQGQRVMTHSVNLTVPRHSVAYDASVTMLAATVKYNAIFTFSKMVAKAKSDWFHIGWWHADTQQRFEHKSWTSSLDFEIEDSMKTAWPIISKLDGTSDLTSYGGHQFVKSDVEKAVWVKTSVTYPWGEGVNTITFKGHYIADHKAANGLSMYREAQLHSSAHGLTIQYQYYALLTAEKLRIFGNALYNNSVRDLKANYQFNMDNYFNPWTLQLFHSFTSPHLYYFGSGISQKAPKEQDLILTSESKSDVWPALNSRLDQYFSYGHSGWEIMNFTSAWSDIKGNVKWTSPWYNDYNKRVALISHLEYYPSMQVKLLFNDKVCYDADLIFDDRSDLIKLNVTTKPGMKNQNFEFNYIENGAYSPLLWGNLQILSDHVFVGNVSYKLENIISAFDKILPRFLYDKFVADLDRISKDSAHGMNKLLSPILGGQTVSEFGTSTKKYFEEASEEFSENARSMISTWEVFYGPSLEIPVNFWNELKLSFWRLDRFMAQKTFSGWAWYYFDVPGYLASPEFRRTARREVLKQIASTFVIPKKDGFMFMVLHPFRWLQFDTMPVVTPELSDFLSGKQAAKTKPNYPDYKTAIVHANGLVYTFDENSYYFNEYPVDGCMYLLAADVKNGKFSLMKTKDSIVLALRNNLYRIDANNKVYINSEDQPKHLPLDVPSGSTDPSSADISALDNLIMINTTVGLFILCDSTQKVCVIKMSENYSGKTAGLLGNMDGEDYTDTMMSSGKRTEDIFSFVASYEVSGQKGCADVSLMKNKKQSCAVADAAKNQQRCEKLFNHRLFESQNYGCFASVFPGPFLDVCNQRAKCDDFSTCDLQSAYAAACYNRGVGKIPTCAKCKGLHEVGQEWKERTTRHVQVAIIIDRSSDMFSSDNQQLTGVKSLLNKIDSTFLNDKGYSSRSYALVSYNGHNQEDPRIHHASDQVWQNLETMEVSTLRMLSFDGKKRMDPMLALQFAAKNLDFEPESSKVFIIVTPDDEMGHSEVSETLRSLQSQGISLYTIADFPEVYKGKHIYGVRGDGYVFPHPVEAKKAGKEILFVLVPNGPLAKLTSALHGAIFHRKFLEENVISAYFTEIAEEMLAKVDKEVTQHKTCQCIQDEWWYVRARCQFG